MAEIDVKKLNKSFVRNFSQKKNDLQPKAAKSQEIVGLGGFEIFDDTVDTVCEAWPKVKPFIKMGLKYLGWIFPSQVAMANAVLTALDEELFPMICQKGGEE